MYIRGDAISESNKSTNFVFIYLFIYLLIKKLLSIKEVSKQQKLP